MPTQPRTILVTVLTLIAGPSIGWGLFYITAALYPALFFPEPSSSANPLAVANAGFVLGLLIAVSRTSQIHRSASVVTTVFLTLFVFAVLPANGFQRLYEGVDPSWVASLALAVEQGLVFGSDFLFTYGPLGFLMTGLPPEHLAWAAIAHDVALALDLLWITWAASSRVRTPLWWPLSFLVFAALSVQLDRTYAPYVWMAVLGIHCGWFSELRKPSHLGAAWVVSLLLVFSKLSVALVAPLAVVYVLVSAALTSERTRSTYWLLVAAYCGSLLFGAAILRVDIYGYVVGAAHVAGSYQDAMYILPTPRTVAHMLLWEATAVVPFIATVVWHRRKFASTPGLFTLGYTAGLLLLAFKQGHIRQWGAFQPVESLVLWMFLALVPVAVQRAATAVLVAAVVATAVIRTDLFEPSRLSQQWTNVRSTSTEFWNVLYDGWRRPTRSTLPASVARLLETGTVDVMMSETSIAYLEGLNYKPRPVIQSYAAYDPYLDRLNARKLEVDGPQFVLFHVHITDDRYWFFDESEARLALWRWYDEVGHFDRFVIFERRETPRELSMLPMGPAVGRLNQPIALPSAVEGVIVGSFGVEYSFLGRLARLLFLPPPLRITLELQDGSAHEFRAVVPIVRGRTVVDRFVRDLDAFRRFVAGRSAELPSVRSVTLHTPYTWAFQPSFVYNLELVLLEEPLRPASLQAAPRRSRDGVPRQVLNGITTP